MIGRVERWYECKILAGLTRRCGQIGYRRTEDAVIKSAMGDGDGEGVGTKIVCGRLCASLCRGEGEAERETNKRWQAGGWKCTHGKVNVMDWPKR